MTFKKFLIYNISKYILYIFIWAGLLYVAFHLPLYHNVFYNSLVFGFELSVLFFPVYLFVVFDTLGDDLKKEEYNKKDFIRYVTVITIIFFMAFVIPKFLFSFKVAIIIINYIIILIFSILFLVTLSGAIIIIYLNLRDRYTDEYDGSEK